MSTKKDMDVAKLEKICLDISNKIKEKDAKLDVLMDLCILRSVKDKGIKGAAYTLDISMPTIYKTLRKYGI